MSLRQPIKLTYEDLLETPDDGKRYEIIDGVLYVSPSPSRVHQRLLLKLITLLAGWVEEHDLGEVFLSPFDVLLGIHDIVIPDIVYVSKERLGIVDEANVKGPPDLVVEIISPTSRRRDTVLKMQRYALL